METVKDAIVLSFGMVLCVAKYGYACMSAIFLEASTVSVIVGL